MNNNVSRNAPCHCGSGKKYKLCCLRAGDDGGALLVAQRAPDIPQTELLAVLMPTRDGQMSIETSFALSSNSGPLPMLNIYESRRPIVEARNTLAQQLRKAREQFSLRYALWADSDAWWPPGTLERMLAIMNQHVELDMLTAYSCDRKPFCAGGQFIFHAGVPYSLVPHGMRVTHAAAHRRFKTGDVVGIDATSFHFVLMRASLLDRLGPEPFNVPDTGIFGEDMQFCFRAKEAGAKIACDTGSIVAHVDVDSGLAFIPNQRPGRIDANAFGFVADARSDEEIAVEWQALNIRANRTYGADVDAILQRGYEVYARSVSESLVVRLKRASA